MAAKQGPGRPRKSTAHKKAVDKARYKRIAKTPEKKRRVAARGRARRAMEKKLGRKLKENEVVDHIKPLSKGGTNAPSNLRVTSRKKNRSKSNK